MPQVIAYGQTKCPGSFPNSKLFTEKLSINNLKSFNIFQVSISLFVASSFPARIAGIVQDNRERDAE